MIRKDKTLYLIFFLLLFFSCSVPHRRLNNGKGNSVPKENYVWKNQSKFDTILYKKIDIDFFYELVDEYHSDKSFKKTRKIEYGTLWKFKIQFYPNGRLRRFASKYPYENPEIEGNRGIIYKCNEKIKLDIMEGVSNNRIAINTYRVKISGDTIFVLTSYYDPTCYVFKKCNKIPDSYKSYKVNW